MSVSATLTGNLSLTDSVSGTTQLVKVVSGGYTGTETSMAQNAIIGTSPVSLALPVSPAQFLYLKNLSAVNTLTVTWTPNGGSSNVILTLQPGAFIVFSETNATSGITALSVTASATATAIEFLILG